MAATISLKHGTTKAVGERVFAVADWNADHQITADIDISPFNFTAVNGTFSGDVTGKAAIFSSANGISPGGDAENVGTFTSGDGADGIEILGGNLVTNGTFTGDTDWEKNLWTIGGGTANVNTTASNGNYVRQSIAISNGVKYKVTYDLVSIGGTSIQPAVQVTLGGTSGANQYQTGTKTEYITAGGSDTYVSFEGVTTFVVGTVIAQIDNVIVQEVTQEGDAGDGGDFYITLGSAGSPDGDGTSARAGKVFINTVLDVPVIEGLVDLSLSGDLTVGGDITADDGTLDRLRVERIGVATNPSDNVLGYFSIALPGTQSANFTGDLISVQQNVDAADSNLYTAYYGSIRIDDDTNKHNINGYRIVISSDGSGGINELNCFISDLASASNLIDIDNLYHFHIKPSFFSSGTNQYGLMIEDIGFGYPTNNYGIVLNSDDEGWGAIWFGAGQDSKIWYDGTDMNINPAVVGSGSLTIGDGGTTNYTEIKADGEINLHGTARVVNHVIMPAETFKLIGAKPAVINNEGIYITLDFVHTAEKEAYSKEFVPFRWDSDTDVEVGIDWLTDADGTGGDVVWGIEYSAKKDNEAIAGGTTTITQAFTGAGAGLMQRNHFTTKLLKGNLEADDILGIRIFRDHDAGGDTLDLTARMLAIHLHFIRNKIGQAT